MIFFDKGEGRRPVFKNRCQGALKRFMDTLCAEDSADAQEDMLSSLIIWKKEKELSNFESIKNAFLQSRKANNEGGSMVFLLIIVAN